MNERWLLLNGLLIGIAPCADLQATADPAQSLRGIRGTCPAANGTLPQSLDLIGLNRPFGFFEKLLVDHRLRNRQRFPFHTTETKLTRNRNVTLPDRVS